MQPEDEVKPPRPPEAPQPLAVPAQSIQSSFCQNLRSQIRCAVLQCAAVSVVG
jgi:hypothetical protein